MPHGKKTATTVPSLPILPTSKLFQVGDAGRGQPGAVDEDGHGGTVASIRCIKVGLAVGRGQGCMRSRFADQQPPEVLHEPVMHVPGPHRQHSQAISAHSP